MSKLSMADLKSIGDSIKKELARHGWKVQSITHQPFGTGDIFFVTIKGEIYTFLKEKTGGVGGYPAEAMWLHDDLYELAPETTEFVIVDTGEDVRQLAHILVIMSPGG